MLKEGVRPGRSDLQQAWWGGDAKPALGQVHFRHDWLHEGDQDQAWLGRAGWLGRFPGLARLWVRRQVHLQQVVAGMEQVSDPANYAAIGQQAHLQAHQIEQVEFALGQGGAVAGGRGAPEEKAP